ncbi:hypothetical protein FOA22_22545 [Heyndrickxia oleronia]|uniref:hypothetical protein n=1 Tax=Heyndrickxia oleronia TaxID=38875 RepID=UPI0033376ABC
MNLVQLKKILDETGYPVTYSHFTPTDNNPVPDPPYICYWTPYSSHYIADNKVYQKIENVQIELYTLKKDLTAESKLESVLDKYGIPYQTTETFIESENLFQRIYEARLI